MILRVSVILFEFNFFYSKLLSIFVRTKEQYKYMANNNSVRENEQDFKDKIQYGDFITLAKLIGCSSSDSARMRFNRGDSEANEAMKKIIENRENLIEKFTKDKSN